MSNGFRSFRERIGLKTQSELAKKLGIKSANISEWEKGTGTPSFAQVKKLLEMGATVEELFGIPYAGQGGQPVKFAFSDAEAAELVRRGLRCIG